VRIPRELQPLCRCTWKWGGGGEVRLIGGARGVPLKGLSGGSTPLKVPRESNPTQGTPMPGLDAPGSSLHALFWSNLGLSQHGVLAWCLFKSSLSPGAPPHCTRESGGQRHSGVSPESWPRPPPRTSAVRALKRAGGARQRARAFLSPSEQE
jgi:hypothetical protein